jgi:type IV pilus assembly protein PilV
MRPRDSQAGVMLIEALIGILIFSIGILALIGMQAAAMRNTTDAKYRSEAGFLANQIISQMWVDRALLPSYDTTNAAAYAPRDTWKTKVGSLLPQGTGVITVGAAAPDTDLVTVTVSWTQPGETQTRKFEMTNRINGGS